MSGVEESMSEGFSASDDEWVPNEYIRGGESSDDDDSEFEAVAFAGNGKKRGEPKARSAVMQTREKRSGLSLRTKLYNKYRPPPKKSPFSSVANRPSPKASSSRTNSKNLALPNEGKDNYKSNDEESGCSSETSIGNYLVNFEDIDIQSSFFKISPVPALACDAGQENLSDSTSEGEKNQAKSDEKTFDFKNLLEYAKCVERFKERVAKHNANEANKKSAARNIDVYSVLALGEKQYNRSHNDGEDEDYEYHTNKTGTEQDQPAKVNNIISTRIKFHTKTRPSSIAANDSDHSDWEEVAGSSVCVSNAATTNDIARTGNLEVHVELPTRNGEKNTKTQPDVEMAFKRRLNRNLKERQVLLHKCSLLCRFGRSLFYNRLLNNTILMQKALKLLPSKTAYPMERGTEFKYFQSMVTWYKSAIKLKTQNLYPENSASKTKSKALVEILKQIENKEARCKQDMIFIFIIILRGMGLQCRLIVNVQPLPLRPAQSDLLAIKIKSDDVGKGKSITKKVLSSHTKMSTEVKTYSKNNVVKQEVCREEANNEVEKKSAKKFKNEELSIKPGIWSDDSKDNTKSIKKVNSKIVQSKQIVKAKHNVETRICNSNIKNTAITKSIKPTENKSNKETLKLKKQGRECRNLKTHDTTMKSAYLHTSDEPLKLPKCEHGLPEEKLNDIVTNAILEQQKNVQEVNEKVAQNKSSVARLKRENLKDNESELKGRPSKKHITETGFIIPKAFVHKEKNKKPKTYPVSSSSLMQTTRARSKSPQPHISTAFLLRSTNYKEKFPGIVRQNTNEKKKAASRRILANKVKISTDFLQTTQIVGSNKHALRSRQKSNEVDVESSIPQLDGVNDGDAEVSNQTVKSKTLKKKHQILKKLKVMRSDNSDEDFEPSPPKKPKNTPALMKKNRRVVSSDDENDKLFSTEGVKKPTAGGMWIEVWCDVEEQWICLDIFDGKIDCVDTIRKSASSLAYVFAFQNDLSVKDVTARYCGNWPTVVRKSRIDKQWLDAAISKYLVRRTKRDIKEDQELRRIHEEKPMPTAISEYKNHPFFALERHLLKFEAIYPPDAPALGYVRGEAVYSRDCVHTLHSRELWLKQARTIKVGETPYKIVKARPKWNRITQAVTKDQPLEIFGFWQTEDYEPPIAENGLVPRNAYGNVELFKPSMLPKKTKHIQLPGLNRICKKLGIDCANAVVGFDFHQGACHPTYNGFVVCEEFEDQVIAAWHQYQLEQALKEREKYKTRVYGNWKKLIRGLLIREHLKLKYNF